MTEEKNSIEQSHEQFLSRFNKSEEPNKRKLGDDDGWGGMGGYMKIKNQKLGEQNELYRKISDIFSSISIWVNGYTNPSSDELKRLICEHGGKYQHYFSKTYVTHIIATNLPDSKIKNLKKNDKVVHPNWIVDSVQEGKLLPEDKYIIYTAAKRDGNTVDFHLKQQKEQIVDTSHATVADISEENFLVDESETSIGPGPCEQYSSKLFDSDEEDNFSTYTLDHKPGDSSKPNLSTHTYSKPNTSKAMLKAGDKNYIEEFYAHSRLHHLSMWKAELKKFTASIQEKWGSKNDLLSKKKNGKTEQLIMHVDLDSFFASVALIMNPELKGKPIAVCHSGGNTSGSDSWSEIASCSYEARKFGLHNGMLLKDAKRQCPQLVCVPYQFDKYREVSQKFYEIISRYTCQVQAVSCDEVLLDISELVSPGFDVLELAENIRRETFNATQCTASCGIGNSILIARLATKQAKPDGKCYIPREEISDFILQQCVKDLPGVGYSTRHKLDVLGIKTCADLQKWLLPLLQKEFGKKFGETLYKFARGIDKRQVKTDNEIKSISAEINYGMRFEKDEDVENFVKDLSVEIERRLKENKRKGKLLTLKIMAAQKDASNPSKYMGHGICNSLSKSYTLPFATDDPKIIGEACIRIMRSLKISAEDYRGIGIQVSKLTGDLTDSSHVGGLNQFVKPVTSEELFEKDKSTRFLNDIKTLNTSPGKKSSTDKHGTTTSETFDKNIKMHFTSSSFPRLPSMDIDSLETLDTFVTTSTTDHCASLDWDPDVLEELPEHIKIELLKHQNDQLVRAGESSTSSKIHVENSSSKQKVNKTRNTKKLQNVKNSPSKRKQVVSKKLKDSSDKTKFRIDQHLQSKQKKIIQPSVIGYHASSIDFEIVNALPESMKNEILAEINRSDTSAQSYNTNNEDNILRVECNQASNDINEILLLSPSQMDQSVLQALPQDVRDDVINDARNRKNQLSLLKNSGQRINPMLNDEFSSVSSNSLVICSAGVTTVTSKPTTHSTSLSVRTEQNDRISTESMHEHMLPRIKAPVVINKSVDNSNTICTTVVCGSSISTASCFTNVNSTQQSAFQSDSNKAIINDTNVISTPKAVDNISSLDLSILRALPEDIRMEVLSDNNFTTKDTTSGHVGSTTTTSNDKSILSVNVYESGAKSVNKARIHNSEILLSPSQIDKNVLDVLPLSIQREVVMAAKLEKQKRARMKENEIQQQQQNDHMETINDTKVILKNVKLKQNMPMLCGASSCNDVKKALRNWVNTYSEPLPEDINEIIDYFHQLLASYNMENLYSFILFFRRIVSPHSSWYKAFNEVLKSVQIEMKSSYSGCFPVLPLPVL